MDIFLKPKAASEWFRFPLMPDRINISTGANVISLSIINVGQVKLPRGNQLAGYSWNGLLPGEHMSDVSFVFDWQPPATIIKTLKDWQDRGTTLTLMVTELSINEDVFIEGLKYEYFGAGDCSYSITLTVRKELIVSVMPKPLLPEDTPTAGTVEETKTVQIGTVTGGSVYYRSGPSTKYRAYGTYHRGDTLELISKSGNWWKFKCSKVSAGYAWMSASYIRVTSTTTTGDSALLRSLKAVNATTSGKGGNTYTVKTGDTLYTIAKTQLGNGTRYPELYAMNQTAIDTLNKGKDVNRYTIYVGLILKLPS